MQPDSIDCKKMAVFLLPFFIIIILFIFALNAYPVAGGDSIYYVATAINHKLGHGLINQLSPMFLVGDPSGAGKFLVFPPLFPLVLIWLMPTGTPQGAHMAMFMLYAATILLASFIYRKLMIPDWGQVSWYRIVIYIFSLFSLAAITIFYPGRPETLARLLVTLALFGLLYPHKNWLWLLLGAVLGLNIATHPGPAILFAPLIGIFFAFYHPIKKALGLTFLAFTVSLIVFFLITQVFSYGALPTALGVFHQFSRLNANLSPAGYLASGQPSVIIQPFLITQDFLIRIIANLTVSRGAAFQGLIITFALAFSLLFYRRFKNIIAAPSLFYLFSLLTAGLLFLLLVYKQNLSYVFALTPLWILIIAYYSTTLAYSKILKFAALAVIILSSLIFFHRVALFPFLIKSGMSLERARAAFQQLPLDPNQRIGVDGTIWPISENYSRMYLWGDYEDVKYPTTTIIMREGVNGWTELPAELSYCRAVKDFFTRKKPVIFGIPLANTMPGYAFSVYDCSSGVLLYNE